MNEHEHETIADIIAEKRQEANYIVQFAQGKCHARRDKAEDEARDIRREADRLEAAHKREITILIDALAEVVASIEVRFPAIEYALDRKPYLDAKKILEQYKDEAALATTSRQTTQED